MTVRITNLAANNQLLNYLLQTQSRLHDTQVQVASEKKSQDYAGISMDSRRLVNLENAVARLGQFTQNNDIMGLQLETAETIVEGIERTVHDFRELLITFDIGVIDSEQRVKDLQDAAFRALKDIEVHLNSEFDGRYLFAGSRVDTQPVDFNLTDLAAFQAAYDGESVLYPPTRDAHVGANLTTDPAVTGGLTFSGSDTISAAVAGSLASVPVGSTITLAGTAANDGTYTVVANDGTNITVDGTIPGTGITVTNTVTNGGPDAGATISTASYYSGDTVASTYRVSERRTFEMDVTAIDPAFEKAIRAIGIIAQGAYGTNGGLENNMQRVSDAFEIINSALELNDTGSPPYGPELKGNIEQIEMDMGYQRVLLDRTIEQNKKLIGFFEQQIADIENVDKLEAVNRLLDDENSLEASYQALARIKQLSLTNFL